MDAKDLRTLVDGIAKSLPAAMLENAWFEQLVFSIGKIASHLESEQEKRIRLGELIDQHQKIMNEHTRAMDQFDKQLFGDRNDLDNHPGIANEWAAARKQSKRNEKFLIGVLLAITPLALEALLRLFGVHLKP